MRSRHDCGKSLYILEVRMSCRIGLWTLVVAAVVLGCASAVQAADLEDQIRTIRAVAAEGRGNQEAAAAWRELVRQRAKSLPEILAACDEANPIAVNYLRSAAETIAQRELEKGGKL